MTKLSKLQSEAVKEFNYNFPYEGIIIEDNGQHYSMKDIKQFLSDQIEKAVEETKKEMEIELENEYDSGFEDGVEQEQKEGKKELISKIESKSIMVKAYENGPLIADSLIITFDDWLEIKSGRKSNISFKQGE